MGLTSAPLAPVLKMVVLDVADAPTAQGNWRLRVLNGLCTREFSGLRGIGGTARRTIDPSCTEPPPCSSPSTLCPRAQASRLS